MLFLEFVMDVLYVLVNIIIIDCVMVEFEKLGFKYCMVLMIVCDERWMRFICDYKGIYVDDVRIFNICFFFGVLI